MDNQLVQPTVMARRIAIVAVAALLAILVGVVTVYLFRLSDPYIQEVLSLESNIERGEAIFEINCAGCHGREGNGNVGPSLHNISQRKSDWGLIHQVVSGDTPPMPKFQPSPQEMADLLGYLEQL